MKVVKKNVYYCDHCNKKGLAACHIRNHEARCTNNQNRHCGACGRESIIQAVSDMKSRFTLEDNCNFEENHDEKLVTWIGEPITLKEVRELAEDCPACMLAILRQTGLNRHYFHLDPFDFKEEMKEWNNAKRYDESPYDYL